MGNPTILPPVKPTNTPTNSPSVKPAVTTTNSPSVKPTVNPTILPPVIPTNTPTNLLSVKPTQDITCTNDPDFIVKVKDCKSYLKKKKDKKCNKLKNGTLVSDSCPAVCREE